MRAPGADRADARRESSRWRAIAFWVGGPLLILGVSVGTVAFMLPGLRVSLWWPAAGVSVALALRARASHRPAVIAMVLVTTTAGNLLAERSPTVSILYGIANSIEVALLTWLLLRGRDQARLRTTADAVRLIAMTAISSVAFALMVAAISTALGTGQALSAAIVTGASHFAAVVLIVPLVIFERQPQSRPAAPELLAQCVLMALVIAGCLGPLTPLPLAFVVFVPLSWATLRLPPLVAHSEAIIIAVVALMFTRLGIGSFAGSGVDAPSLGIVVTVFLAAIAVFTVMTTTQRNESLMHARIAVDAAEDSAEAARATTATLQVRYDLERQRQDFLSTTSHELRTPVTIIAGYSELLSELALPDEAAPWIDAVRRNTGRLAAMLDDLLTFGRTQQERPRPVEVTTSDLVTIALGRHSDAAAARAIAVSVTVPTAGESVVVADRDDAARSLTNLISNAVKFTPDGGSIRIEISEVADDTMITVVDTGPGIGPDALAQVFDPFYRGEQSEARAMPGTGLGLPIARMLARRNGGEVMLVSFPGLGTKATLLLPRTRPVGDATPEENLHDDQ